MKPNPRKPAGKGRLEDLDPAIDTYVEILVALEEGPVCHHYGLRKLPTSSQVGHVKTSGAEVAAVRHTKLAKE